MPEVPEDPITALMDDHRRVDELFAAFQSSSGDEARDVLQEIVRELSTHAAVEEQALYPAMRQALAGGDEKVDHAIDEHQQVKETLDELDGADPGGEDVASQVSALAASVQKHVSEEEEELFPALRDALGPAGLTEMALLAEKARGAAPTRPHPHAPTSGAAQAVAGTVAGVVDKARDAARRVMQRSGDDDPNE